MTEQLALPFYVDEAALTTFLTQWMAIEDEEERLREEKRLLKARHADDFPMRGVLTAVKVVRARTKLAEHPREGMPYVHQRLLEALVEQHLRAQTPEGQVPDMTGAAS